MAHFGTGLLFAVLLSGLAGCTEEAPPPPPVDAPPAEPVKNEAPPLEAVDPASLKSDDDAGLVPSVRETQKALDAAGLNTQLATLIVERDIDVRNQNLDNAAVRTGVIIADLLLTVKDAEKEKMVGNLNKVKVGMTQLNGGQDIIDTIDDISGRVKADAITRENLLKELDELSGAVIPELEFNGQVRVVPLIQAGSWLEGANLVAKACKQANNPAAADNLLKQPAVVDYFIRYVKEEGSDKAPAAITEKLDASLQVLKGLSTKEGSFTAEDIDTVIKTTDDVLALL
jgi:hypothetical protein